LNISTPVCNAFGDFFDALGGPQWNACEDKRSDPCSCFVNIGIKIHCEDNSLTSISLYQAGLIGTIPSALAAMTDLVHLNLADNEINGTIPVDVWKSMRSLTFLELNTNDLTGQCVSVCVCTTP
jgi:hypothetical protein